MAIQKAMSLYSDDIFVNQSVCTAVYVKAHLQWFGLTIKNPECLESGSCLLGLHVWEVWGKLQWSRGSDIALLPNVLTSRSIFSLCSMWLAPCRNCIHQTACKFCDDWLGQWAAGPTSDLMLTEIFIRLTKKDSVQGDWCIDGHKVTMWVDAKSLATDFVVESGEYLVEDAYWLWSNHEGKYINLAELNAILRGINMAIQLRVTMVHLMTNSTCVHR